jgi:hypothetical protein
MPNRKKMQYRAVQMAPESVFAVAADDAANPPVP